MYIYPLMTTGYLKRFGLRHKGDETFLWSDFWRQKASFLTFQIKEVFFCLNLFHLLFSTETYIFNTTPTPLQWPQAIWKGWAWASKVTKTLFDLFFGDGRYHFWHFISKKVSLLKLVSSPFSIETLIFNSASTPLQWQQAIWKGWAWATKVTRAFFDQTFGDRLYHFWNFGTKKFLFIFLSP